jgi:hypothetical protein
MVADLPLRSVLTDVGMALQAGHPTGLGLQLAVHRPGRTTELDEPAPLHQDLPFPAVAPLGIGDLLVDPAQRPRGPGRLGTGSR